MQINMSTDSVLNVHPKLIIETITTVRNLDIMYDKFQIPPKKEKETNDIQNC
jgi:hypothetical protein